MVKRERYLEILRDLKNQHVIKVLTGVRRCGKSTLLRQFRDELQENGVPSKNIIYFNLEEEENLNLTKNESALHEAVMSAIEDEKQNYYVFIDEIQLAKDFERQLNSLHAKMNLDLYVSGSNAHILSSDLSTYLTGRYVEIKVQPLLFSEFVQFFSEDISKYELFSKYQTYGGFPEVANFLAGGAESRVKLYLEGVYNSIIEKDIKSHANFQSMETFLKVADFTFDNIGNPTSSLKISNSLTSYGDSVDDKTVSNFLSLLVGSFVLYRAKRFDIRGKEKLKSLPKYYSVDIGLANYISGQSLRSNFGHRLENIVYLELLARNGEVFVGKNYDKEIDFVIRNFEGGTKYYQVAQTVRDESVYERELAPIKNTGDNSKKTILTMDFEEFDDNGIRQKNIVRWLLKEK